MFAQDRTRPGVARRLTRTAGKAGVVMTAVIAASAFATPAFATGAGTGVAVPTAVGTIESGGGAFTTCNSLHCISVTITVNSQPTGIGADAVAVSCQATSTPDPSSTTITSCTAGNAIAPALSLPGAYVTTAGAGLDPPGVVVNACVSASGTFVENIAGGSPVTTGGCTRVVVV